LEDVVSAAEWLRRLKGIHHAKIAIAGVSYGGYMTLMALTTKPNAFAAGFAGVPITDWVELMKYEDAAFVAGDEELWGGSVALKEELLRSRSPITHISRIKAPVMIMGGKTDANCDIRPVLKFVQKLKEMDHPHEFILLDKAGHISSWCDRIGRAREIKSMIDFLKKNMA